jgi:hypothetical protein
MKHHLVSTSVSELLEQKRKQDAGAVKAPPSEQPSDGSFIPATARPDLTNPFATPGSGMFPDSFDPMAPSG